MDGALRSHAVRPWRLTRGCEHGAQRVIPQPSSVGSVELHPVVLLVYEVEALADGDRAYCGEDVHGDRERIEQQAGDHDGHPLGSGRESHRAGKA